MITEHAYDDYDMKLAEWRGETVKTLTVIDEEIKGVRKDLKEMDNKIDQINEQLTNLRIKVAGIGATSALIVSLIMYFILPAVIN